jgi:hypothetical protein
MFPVDQMALSQPIAFDPRRDHWFPPEQRLFVAYFSRRWKKLRPNELDFLRQFALTVSQHFQRARHEGRLSLLSVDYEAHGGLASVLAPVKTIIAELPTIPDWDALADRNRRSLAPTARADLTAFADTIIEGGFADVPCEVSWTP